jgi:hypothetical protein
VRTSTIATPIAGATLIQRESRSFSSTTPGTTIIPQSARGTIAHQAMCRRSATSARTAIAISAVGKLAITSTRLSPPPKPLRLTWYSSSGWIREYVTITISATSPYSAHSA